MPGKEMTIEVIRVQLKILEIGMCAGISLSEQVEYWKLIVG